MTTFRSIHADTLWFLGDTHFRDSARPGERERKARFVRFVDSLDSTAALMLIGDIFDFYFEYQSVVPRRYIDIYSALERCRRRGVDVHFIGGNHDYWVGAFLRDDLGIQLHGDEIAIEAQGRRIVCSHGDLVMPSDFGYKILKAVLRNRVVIATTRLLHPDVLSAIATGVAAGSRRLQGDRLQRRAREVSDHAHRTLFRRGNNIYIMGHVHHALHDAREGNEFVIVGDWETDSICARLCGGKLELVRVGDG